MTRVSLILHDLRSCYNVGSILRTAEGMGVREVYFSGTTPYPHILNDDRLPHLAQKITRQIQKTALGAEETLDMRKGELVDIVRKLKAEQFEIVALEQQDGSTTIQNFLPSKQKVALMVGAEVEGLDRKALSLANVTAEIPMLGQKESFNVAVAAAIALYQLRFSVK